MQTVRWRCGWHREGWQSERMAVGGWRLAVGGWRLAVGGWRLAVGGWRLAVGGWLARWRSGGGQLKKPNQDVRIHTALELQRPTAAPTRELSLLPFPQKRNVRLHMAPEGHKGQRRRSLCCFFSVFCVFSVCVFLFVFPFFFSLSKKKSQVLHLTFWGGGGANFVAISVVKKINLLTVGRWVPAWGLFFLGEGGRGWEGLLFSYVFCVCV